MDQMGPNGEHEQGGSMSRAITMENGSAQESKRAPRVTHDMCTSSSTYREATDGSDRVSRNHEKTCNETGVTRELGGWTGGGCPDSVGVRTICDGFGRSERFAPCGLSL